MPKFFCDYCDVYLTHDSMAVRKAHNSGRNHLRNVIDYYQQIGHEKAQSVIDSITSSYAAEGQAHANPMLPHNQPHHFPRPMGPGHSAPGGFPPPFAFPGPGGVPPPFPGMPPLPPPGPNGAFPGGLPPPLANGMPPFPFPPPANTPDTPGGRGAPPFPPPGMPFPPPGLGGNASAPFQPPGGFPPFPPPGGFPAAPVGMSDRRD